jgi:ABC-type phosphate transport system substrate-binding protein
MKTTMTKRVAAVSVALAATFASGAVAKAESATGGGASFPVQFLTPAIAEFNATKGHSLTYTSTGSGTGKRNFRSGTFKFAGTDSAVTGSDIPTFGWTYVPYVSGAIGIGYRLDELGGATLSLSKDSINGIFSGTITNWNDSRIAADMRANPTWTNTKKKSDIRGVTTLWQNLTPTEAFVTVSMLPKVLKEQKGKKVEVVDDKTKNAVGTATVGTDGEFNVRFKHSDTATYSVKVGGKTVASFKKAKDVKLPDRPIQVVYRADTSGTTNNFCQYMKGAVNSLWNVNDAFANCVPGGVAQFGSRFVGQPQSNNLSNYVASTNGTITYTEVAYITDPSRAAQGMRAAYVRNNAGIYVAPTSENYNAHLSAASIDASGFVTFNWAAKARTAYPIGAITYMLCQTSRDAQNVVIGEFVQWMISEYGPKNAEALGYTPVLGKFQQTALTLAKRCGAG